MTVLFSSFDRSVMPNNLLTVAEWLVFARNTRKRSWEGAARYFAERSDRGGALVLKGDDTLVCFTRLEDGKIRKTSHKPGTWGWVT